ncbi:MAG TPA: adenylate/guanylate cyclase domain-containing protein [Acidimicrobiia bacterium]|nr:adenylate/guanylate cyclase domain-containing protein [Acidimicrobiia bacterium]
MATPEPGAGPGPDGAPNAERELGVLPNALRPLVDRVARLPATVHVKLLTGFLIIALLLLAMGVLSIVVIGRMNQQVVHLNDLQAQTDLARQAIYSVTAQSHYRAMALITRVDSWNDKIDTAKSNFASTVDQIEALDAPISFGVIDRLRSIDVRFAAAGDEVLALYEAGDFDRALSVHISAEHEISHELEDELNTLIADSATRMATNLGNFRANREFLTMTVAIFAAVSLLTALSFGAILSWSLIRPVRKIDVALARIADGDFSQHVDVPNRDEFGRLTLNLNRTSGRLATLYSELTHLNQNLEQTIEEQLAQLRRTEQLRRYVSPQVADAIISEGSRITLAPTRRNLTILVSDIRGFTMMSERMEPEELVDALNQYFGIMTDVVFRHGGTLDKYLGDGILAFFGDPIPFEDHAERAVATAFEMQEGLDRLREMWMVQYEEELTVGIGISTGYVTVGNIGSANRTEYTVIGNHVNLASRLATTASAGQVLVTDRTMAAARDLAEGTEVEVITLKGVQRPVRVFDIVRKTATTEAAVDLANARADTELDPSQP